MDEIPEPHDGSQELVERVPDLAALERIEGELFAVERALELIDEGVYEGFPSLPLP